MDHAWAPAGKSEKYARPERERRFLLRAVPPGVVVKSVALTDRYLDGTRIRLRRAQEIGGRAIYKLTQKIPGDHGGPGLITTIYLDESEHRALATVPAHVLEKTRHSIPPYGVDVFGGALAGLVLAEVEFDDDESLASFAAPAIAVAEVTRDVRFTGGRFATMTRPELVALLAMHDVDVGVR